MSVLDASSLWFVFGLFLLIACVFGLRAFLGYRRVAADAAADYDYKRANNMIPKSMGREQYIEIYKRVNDPRGLAYIAVGLGLIIITTPLLFFLLEQFLQLLYNLSGQSRSIEPGYLVWQFSLYFLVVMVWAAIAYIFARRYHRKSTGSLQYELGRAMKRNED